MIKLDVCKYCHDCLEFEPQVTQKPDLFISTDEKYFYGDTVVKCVNRHKCEVLYNHLKKENNNAEN